MQERDMGPEDLSQFEEEAGLGAEQTNDSVIPGFEDGEAIRSGRVPREIVDMRMAQVELEEAFPAAKITVADTNEGLRRARACIASVRRTLQPEGIDYDEHLAMLLEATIQMTEVAHIQSVDVRAAEIAGKLRELAYSVRNGSSLRLSPGREAACRKVGRFVAEEIVIPRVKRALLDA